MPLPQARLLLLQVRLTPVAPIAAPAINPPSTPVTPPPATVHGFQMSPLEELAMLGAPRKIMLSKKIIVMILKMSLKLIFESGALPNLLDTRSREILVHFRWVLMERQLTTFLPSELVEEK